MYIMDRLIQAQHIIPENLIKILSGGNMIISIARKYFLQENTEHTFRIIKMIETDALC